MWIFGVLWFLVLFGATIFVAVMTVLGLVHAARGRYRAALVCLGIVLVFPALHIADVARGWIAGRPFAEVKIEAASAGLPVVLALREAGHCSHVCREALARGFAPEIVQTSGLRHRFARRPEEFVAHRLGTSEEACSQPSSADHMVQSIGGKGGAPCVIGRRVASLPAHHVRISFDAIPFPRVVEAGFPRLTSDFNQGSYFLVADEVGPDATRLLAQSFRHVRQPVGWIWGWQFLPAGSARQVVGAKRSRDEVLNAVLGWSLVGRLPADDPKPRRSVARRT
ncbi:hypothetical protein [uncultured Enterovirga sp.]|uniref:hypothetical protein n=1 Tax=uncultured Enterovirga sp. TaxID=2026352 RepID=UPI0035C9BE7A